MSDLGILLSDMTVCVACRELAADVETPEGAMCRPCAEEHDHAWWCDDKPAPADETLERAAKRQRLGLSPFEDVDDMEWDETPREAVLRRRLGRR